MKLLVLSDLHGHRSIVEEIYDTSSKEVDALIICGDLTHFGSLNQAQEIIQDLTVFEIPVLFVPGNCDPQELVEVQSVHRAINIHGRFKEIGGLGFLGIGGSSPTPFDTSFEMSEQEIQMIIETTFTRSNPKHPFVLVSHSPPVNTRVDLTSFGSHGGSSAVRAFIEAEKPTLALCGHIHEARGTDILDGTLIVNPGPAHRGLYAVVDVGQGKGTVKAELHSL